MADTIADEVTFGWPRRKSSVQLREHLALNLQRAVNWVPVFFLIKKVIMFYLFFFWSFFS